VFEKEYVTGADDDTPAPSYSGGKPGHLFLPSTAISDIGWFADSGEIIPQKELREAYEKILQI
jgi:hypothetical protein